MSTSTSVPVVLSPTKNVCSMAGLINHRWLWGSQHTSDKRAHATINPPGFGTMGTENHTCQTGGTSGPTNALGPTKTFSKIYLIEVED